jgi:hypothetical protein
MIFPDDIINNIRKRYESMKPFLTDERLRRTWAASEAKILGHGGIKLLSCITELKYETISKGMKEINNPEEIDLTRIRVPGGGRKTVEDVYPGVKEALKKILEDSTSGTPMSPLKWTTMGLKKIEEVLHKEGFPVSNMTIMKLVRELEYSMQGNMKAIAGGAQNPDRNAQFEHINVMVIQYQKKGQPVISIDTKKKENIGEYKNNGKEYRPKGNPRKVKDHDFMDKKLGKVAPYGVYDVTQNNGMVNVGISSDTAVFAAESIRRWWYSMGKPVYPNAVQLLITCDGGGSNGSRTRLWKLELQKLSTELNIEIAVCHYPPGTSKWNKVEHRMFSYISKNWRGRPLISHEVVVNLIASTTTRTGLTVQCVLDQNNYKTGIKVSDDELAEINIHRNDFHGEWNYSIFPIPKNNDNI